MKLIRKVINQILGNLVRIFEVTKTLPRDKNLLDSLAGFIKIKDKKQTNFAQQVDDVIYFRDK